VVKVDKSSPLELSEAIVDEACIFCIYTYKDGGATWTDQVRTCALQKGTVLLCKEGKIQAEGGKGGYYMVLF
jgi:hypothetical protein